MDRKELQIIQELMEKLTEDMDYSSDDLAERLGRSKPEVKVMKIEGEIPHEDELDMEPELEDDMDEMSDDSMMPEMEMSPEEKLKARIMKLRGE